MQYSLKTFVYKSPRRAIEVLVPDATTLQQAYDVRKSMAFPYWGKIWPAAIALAQFIDANPTLVQDKTVLELAGGLGLPALVASQYAARVTGSDYQQPAVDIQQQNVALNNITNMTVILQDWRMLPLPADHDVVLLSDINYEPGMFDELLALLDKLQQAGICIILSTPQRLPARPFMERLLPLSHSHQVVMAGEEYISIVML